MRKLFDLLHLSTRKNHYTTYIIIKKLWYMLYIPQIQLGWQNNYFKYN